MDLNGARLDFGLGWDSVNFINNLYDFGENVLAKGGSSSSFGSFLLVSRKYNLAASISVTHDNRMNSHAMLCELCGILLDEYNITVRKENKKEVSGIVKKPVPAEYAEKFSGLYYNNMDILRMGFDNDSLVIQKHEQDGWHDFMKGEIFDGLRFVSGPTSFMFEEHNGNSYFIHETLTERNATALKYVKCPPLNPAWKNRLNKKYIVCDANPFDIALSGGAIALTIQEFEQKGLLFFTFKMIL